MNLLYDLTLRIILKNEKEMYKPESWANGGAVRLMRRAENIKIQAFTNLNMAYGIWSYREYTVRSKNDKYWIRDYDVYHPARKQELNIIIKTLGYSRKNLPRTGRKYWLSEHREEYTWG